MIIFEESKVYAMFTIAWIFAVLQLSQNYFLKAAKNNI
jgi:hypothetical protein